jgi:outer membrane protein OmpA-like peptidoglycan-associated protein
MSAALAATWGMALVPSSYADPSPVQRTDELEPSSLSPVIIKSIKRTVYFAPLSAHLDGKSRDVLAKAALLVPGSAADVTVRSTGFVQPSALTGNDESLSTERARAVAAALKRERVKGTYFVSGQGRAEQSGPRARRADVVISFTLT